MSNRFKHLERGRSGGPEAVTPVQGQDLSRFGAPAPVAAPEGPAAPTSAQARFSPVEERLELEVMQPGEQPFLRCAMCAHDNTRFVEVCAKCGAPLHTPAQRAFNEQFWSARLAEAATEQQAHVEHLAAQHEAGRLEAAARHQFAVDLAASVAAKVKRELDADPNAPLPPALDLPSPRFSEGPSLAVRLLEKLPSKPARAAVVAVAFGVPLVLMNLSVRHWILQQVGGLALLGVVLAFLPLSWRR